MADKSEARHTPGPWSIVQYGDGTALVIHADTESRVCFMATPGSHGDPAKIAADARLIAAAPDSHEANKASLTVLCAIRNAHTWHENMLKDIDFAIEANRAAIAKATQHG